MLKRSVFSTPSRARVTPPLYCARPIPARTTRTVATTSSSSNVKPRSPPIRSRDRSVAMLPVLVLGAVEGRRIRGRMNVEHVLPAPTRRIGVVLIRPQTPLGGLGHRILGDAAEKL